MAKGGKLILICQYGGKFVTKSDGTLSYEEGEANALNIIHETLFEDLKLKLAEISNLDQKTISIRYFLPGNRRNLISLRNDKDLKRMIDFHGNSITVDIFVDGKEGFDNNAMKLDPISDSHVKLAETVYHISAPSTATPAADNLKNGTSLADTSLDDAIPSVYATAAAKLRDSTSHSQRDGTSPPSLERDAENDSDYEPRLCGEANGDRGLASVGTSGSPADTVKKRRRTASWMLGAHGPTIVSVSDDDSSRRQRKRNNQFCGSLVTCDNRDEKDRVTGTDDIDDPSITCFSDDEKLAAPWRECIKGVGQDFRSVKEFREALQKYAIAHRFVYKLKKNDSNRASGVCVDEGCSWSIHASWVPASKSFKIKKFNDSHSCEGESWKNAHPTKKLLVSVIKEKLRYSPYHKAKEIAKSISQDFGLELKYNQVRRGIEDAREQLQGSCIEAYNCLPWFSEKFVEMNPGSSFKLKTGDEKRLQHLFISFHFFIQIFQTACRRILFLDAISLKSKYQESLLLASALDADNGLFPIALSIVDEENKDSWRWFLEQLKCVVLTSLPITFVSDMEKGLNMPLHEIYENCFHGYSMYHLIESFKRNLKGPFHGEGRGVLPAKLLAAAQAARYSCFKSSIEQVGLISSSAHEWVTQIESEHWANFSFHGEQYTHIVQNVAEPYAKLMEETRESTIIQKLEAIVRMINQMINARQAESSQWTTKLTPTNENKIQAAALKARGMRVFISSDVLFEVHDDSTHVVDFEKRQCTCLEWKYNGIPCCHTIAAFNYLGKNVYDNCPNYFTVESYRLTYSQSINPVVVVDEDAKSSHDVKVAPPVLRLKNEHMKEVEGKMEDPDKRTVTCSKCKEAGHNKASCKANL